MEAILSRDDTSEEKRRRQHINRVSLFIDWKNYTNLKASLCGADQDIYRDWYEFSVEELRMHIGLYVLGGISPSPRIEMEFETQSNDPVNGNDLVNESFGGVPSKSTRRHAMFKAFFDVQDPRVLPPSKKTHANFKIDPFFKHLLQTFKSMWDVVENFI